MYWWFFLILFIKLAYWKSHPWPLLVPFDCDHSQSHSTPSPGSLTASVWPGPWPAWPAMCLRKTRPRPHRVRVQQGDTWEINKHEAIMWSQVCHQEKQEGTLRNGWKEDILLGGQGGLTKEADVGWNLKTSAQPGDGGHPRLKEEGEGAAGGPCGCSQGGVEGVGKKTARPWSEMTHLCL